MLGTYVDWQIRHGKRRFILCMKGERTPWFLGFRMRKPQVWEKTQLQKLTNWSIKDSSTNFSVKSSHPGAAKRSRLVETMMMVLGNTLIIMIMMMKMVATIIFH